MAVSEEARAKGLGFLLMKKIIEQAKADGFRTVSLSVDRGNVQAIHLYKKTGFAHYCVDGTSETMLITL
ncbi:GNAT family N-acetyltransferase [Gracilibacillus salinarum]|uniref:GNAT family N-acetyltransferase n=1 Tax=Gracilibacillus salinarum TaxID=2932255 RepID=A0ABY4GWJ1_9BACI|nr:GNAT family N-acetyltransferase [Gracilibacillus salinarum]UOQ87457.1 GNAT family N-acetyltransferase [Gracilibacillus salinarum]